MIEMTSPLSEFLPSGSATSDELLGRFLDYVEARGLSLYPAQEEAMLALFDERHVILNTPTGSGKSLVAFAMHFAALARGRRSVYTCPIKALVNEKWTDLCRELGPERVGLATSDATVNRDAPVLCCTAEILSNLALREGGDAGVEDVVMDEFHWYADRDRGVAWQVPLLTLPGTRFLLMSATLGDVSFFERDLEDRTGRPTLTVSSADRPVPLDYRYSETPLTEAVESQVEAGRAPVYVVHFTQKEAAESAQAFTSLKVTSKEEKRAISEAIAEVRFTSPHGPRVRTWLRHGIGIHHAGLLPKYRVLVERLAQRGLLKVICGTDTLGVGVNVPIRTVLFSRLCKFDGEKTAVLSARDFHQISGRAGRKGFDEQGFVVAQAPEHVIENRRLADKAKSGKKVVMRKPPKGNFAPWDRNTFERLTTAQPERLRSRFHVSHGMLLNVLGRPGDGCSAMRRLIRDSHETEPGRRAHRRRGWQLFRALVDRGVVEFGSDTGKRVQVNVDLQADFSMDQTLSLYLLEALPQLDEASDTHPLDVLTLVESILEDPTAILRRQLARLKTQAVAEMKAEGLDYDQRMEELEKLEHPKPLREFVYATFNTFADLHPWVEEENIRPKSIAREMFETFRTFDDYVREYDLRRVEGLLLRHLGSVYKVLRHTVPDTLKTEAVREVELYLRDLVRRVDSTLLDEWERLRGGTPDDRIRVASPAPRLERPADLTEDRIGFIRLIRTQVFAVLRAWSIEDDAAALGRLEPFDESGRPWTIERLGEARARFRLEHGGLRLDPEGRNLRHTHVESDTPDPGWRVEQMLVDTEGLNDWVAVFLVDLDASRASGDAVLRLVRIGSLV